MCPIAAEFPASMTAEEVGWKAYHLGEASRTLSPLPQIDVEVPEGHVVLAALFNSTARQRLKDCLLEMLTGILARDADLKEQLEEALGMAHTDVTTSNMEEAWEKLFRLVGGTIAVMDAAAERSRDFAQEVAGAVQEALDQEGFDVGNLLNNNGFVYLRASTFCENEPDWAQYHTGGRFLSVPYHVEDLREGFAEKIGSIYASTLSSPDAVMAVIKSGTDSFSMAVLILPVSPDIDSSGRVATRDDTTRTGSLLINISAREGVDVTPECLLEVCLKLESRHGCVWVSETGQKLSRETVAYTYSWDPSTNAVTRPSNNQGIDQSPSVGQNVRFVPVDSLRKIEPRTCMGTTPLTDEQERKLVEVTKMLYRNLNQGGRWDHERHICWEFAIMRMGELVQVLQCDPVF